MVHPYRAVKFFDPTGPSLNLETGRIPPIMRTGAHRWRYRTASRMTGSVSSFSHQVVLRIPLMPKAESTFGGIFWNTERLMATAHRVLRAPCFRQCRIVWVGRDFDEDARRFIVGIFLTFPGNHFPAFASVSAPIQALPASSVRRNDFESFLTRLSRISASSSRRRSYWNFCLAWRGQLVDEKPPLYRESRDDERASVGAWLQTSHTHIIIIIITIIINIIITATGSERITAAYSMFSTSEKAVLPCRTAGMLCAPAYLAWLRPLAPTRLEHGPWSHRA